MYENRIQHLKEMHAALDKQIDGLEKTGRFDDALIQNLKKQRLSIRDQITELQRRQWHDEREFLDDHEQ